MQNRSTCLWRARDRHGDHQSERGKMICVQTTRLSVVTRSMSVSDNNSPSGDSSREDCFSADTSYNLNNDTFSMDLTSTIDRQAPQSSTSNNGDNIEMMYIRDVLLAQHPFLTDVERAVGRLTDSENADLLNADALSGLIEPDQILLEALRALSDDPSMRKLQASLEVETTIIQQETAAYQAIQSGSDSNGMMIPDNSRQTYQAPKTKRRKFCSQLGIKTSCKAVKKREKTPPESQKLLKDWLFSHSQHPYPTDCEKEELCSATNLSIQQLNNWFINARRRILPSFIQEQNAATITTDSKTIVHKCSTA